MYDFGQPDICSERSSPKHMRRRTSESESYNILQHSEAARDAAAEEARQREARRPTTLAAAEENLRAAEASVPAGEVMAAGVWKFIPRGRTLAR